MNPNISFNPQKVLITVSSINGFSGSELVAFNLAKYFKSVGAEVSIAALKVGQPLLELVTKEEIKVIDVNNELDDKNYDLIWAHHGAVLTTCIFDRKAVAQKVIFSSLGPSEVLERPPIYTNSLSLCLCNSFETRDSALKGKVNRDLLYVFPNSVEEDCFRITKTIKNDSIKKLAIISNHVCNDVFYAADLMRNSGIEVDIFGLGYRVTYVSPKLLEQYDAILTIGRTVQYALVLGIPVYCYDIFGGPGWITTGNVLNEEYYNFSGRGTPTSKTPETIKNEIISGYKNAVGQISSLKEYSKTKFVLKDNIEGVLKVLSNKPNINWTDFHSKYDEMKRLGII